MANKKLFSHIQTLIGGMQKNTTGRGKNCAKAWVRKIVYDGRGIKLVKI